MSSHEDLWGNLPSLTIEDHLETEKWGAHYSKQQSDLGELHFCLRWHPSRDLSHQL